MVLKARSTRACFITSAQNNPEAGELEEGAIGCEEVFMTNEQSSELAELGIGSFYDPAASVAAQLAAIFVAPVPAVLL
jgi:hypothetical protein